MDLLSRIMGVKDSCTEKLAAEHLVIDVRTPAEYAGGHVKKSVNIPLDRIGEHIEDIRSRNVPVVLCCASGARSGRAAKILRASGVDACNGGSWSNVHNAKIK